MRAHRGSPIAALRAVTLITQSLHQLRPNGRRALNAPASRGRLVAEREARQRWAHHMKRVSWVPTVRGRIGQRSDDLEELDNRAGPAMSDHQRQRVDDRGTHVQKMDPEPVDLGPKLRKSIKPSLPRTPVIRRSPVVTQIFQISERDSLRPVHYGLLLRPARPREASSQISELLLPDRDFKWCDLVAHSTSSIVVASSEQNGRSPIQPSTRQASRSPARGPTRCPTGPVTFRDSLTAVSPQSSCIAATALSLTLTASPRAAAWADPPPLAQAEAGIFAANCGLPVSTA